MDTVATLPVESKRWNLSATLGFSVVICALYSLAQAIAMGVAAGIQLGSNPSVDKGLLLDSILKNGFYISIGIIFSAWVGSIIIVTAILLKGDSVPREYLAVKKLPLKVYLRWMIIVPIFVFCWERLGAILGQTGSIWMIQTYASKKYLPLFLIAFVVAAPFVEELFFRGFLFEGLRESWMGPVGAVAVTSIAWAATHMQYELFQIIMIGVLGVILGVAKIKTRSLYVTFAMHSLANVIVIVQVAVFVNN